MTGVGACSLALLSYPAVGPRSSAGQQPTARETQHLGSYAQSLQDSMHVFAVPMLDRVEIKCTPPVKKHRDGVMTQSAAKRASVRRGKPANITPHLSDFTPEGAGKGVTNKASEFNVLLKAGL